MTQRPPLKDFYLTFGIMYPTTTHPHWPGANGGGYVRILAEDEEQARHTARQHFGLAWSHLYEPIHFNVDSEYWPLGELAVIVQERADQPVRWFTSSQPEYYGVGARDVVAVRVEGRLKEDSDEDALEELGYEVELFHPRCATEGMTLFEHISEVDMHVLAFELDWNSPAHCTVCETSIT